MAVKPPPRQGRIRWAFVTLVAGILAVGGLVVWRSTGLSRTGPIESPVGVPWFADVTTEVGLDFVHDPGPVDERYFMPQIVGSGAALFDCDGDGLLDIYLVNNGGPKGRRNVLYRQLPGGRFRDSSGGSGLDFASYCMGVAVGDVNNDGLPDVLVTEYGGLRLFVNEGSGRFTSAKAAGVESPFWGTSACFLDYDRDGWLDLVVANYVAYDPAWPCANAGGDLDYCHPKVFQGTVAKLFHNTTALASSTDASRRPPVRFEDVTVASGLARFPGPGLGVTSADFDGDGWQDIFVANDAHANHLWINQRNGTFEEEAVSRGVAYDAVGRSLANMGVALGDTQGRGLFDLFVSHLPEETNTLWRQGPRGVFVDQSATSGLLGAQWRGTGFGAVLADFNHDSHLDLAIANGRVVRSGSSVTSDHWRAYSDRNQLFAGEGQGRFRDISPDSPDLSGTPNVARALAVGDLDGDGALDLLVTCAGGRVRLLRNVAPERGHWLVVRAVDPRWKRDAYGAQVTVVTGERRQVAWVNPGQSYLTSNDPRVHFGLGSTPSVDVVEVLWPDGLQEQFAGGPTDRILILTRGTGRPATPAETGGTAPQ